MWHYLCKQIAIYTLLEYFFGFKKDSHGTDATSAYALYDTISRLTMR